MISYAHTVDRNACRALKARYVPMVRTRHTIVPVAKPEYLVFPLAHIMRQFSRWSFVGCRICEGNTDGVGFTLVIVVL